MASGSFEDDDELDDSFSDGLVTGDAPMVPIGQPVDEEVWDEDDFDEEFDEDFSDEPDEDLEKFEKELNADSGTKPVQCEEFDEEFE